MTAALSGFFVSLSLILAIGAQNAFVLRQGLRREHVLLCVLTCAVSDAVLIAAGVIGFGQLIATTPWLASIMRYGGAAFLFVYGAMNFRSAWRGGSALQADGVAVSDWRKVLATLLALTWLNPHVYLDTVMLIGAISADYEGARLQFGTGAVLGSFVFFTCLGYGARLLAPLFARPRAWQVLDLLVGCVMWAIALSLIWYI